MEEGRCIVGTARSFTLAIMDGYVQRSPIFTDSLIFVKPLSLSLQLFLLLPQMVLPPYATWNRMDTLPAEIGR